MFFPEFLYQLSARDQQVSWLDPRVVRVQEIQNAAVFSTVAFFVEVGRALLLQNATVLADPGGAQVVVAPGIFIALVVPGGATVRLATDVTASLGGAARSLNWSGNIVVPPGWGIVAGGNFDAGVAANVLTFDFVGMFIPVGNIQRV